MRHLLHICATAGPCLFQDQGTCLSCQGKPLPHPPVRHQCPQLCPNQVLSRSRRARRWLMDASVACDSWRENFPFMPLPEESRPVGLHILFCNPRVYGLSHSPMSTSSAMSSHGSGRSLSKWALRVYTAHPHTPLHTGQHTHTRTHTHENLHMHLHPCLPMHIWEHTTHTYTCIHMHTHTHPRIPPKNTPPHRRTHTHMHTHLWNALSFGN